MPSWKKLLVSGSDASVNSLNVSTFISASNIVGTFTGSYRGDGSQLTGISADIATQSSFTQTFTSVTSSTVVHNLNVDYPLVQVYDTLSELIIPKTVKVIDYNTVQVDFDTTESGNIVIAKGGHLVAFDAPNSNTLNNQSGSYYLDWNNFTNIPANILSSSAQIASDISGAFTDTSSSIAGDITSLDGRLDTLEGKTLLSSSTQISSDISGAFTSVSSSLAGDITGLDGRLDTLEGKTLVSSSVQINLDQITGNTFSSSNFVFPLDLTVQGTLTAEKFNTEYISSSIIYESGSTKFGDTLDDVHEFTGSVEVLGGITGSLLGTSTTSSYVQFTSIDGLPSLISSSVQVEYSQLSGIPVGIISSSGQIANDISGAFTSVSSSIAGDVTGLDSRLDTLEGKTLLSSSIQIASDISGAFSSTSSSIASDITGLDTRLDTLDNKTLVSGSSQTDRTWVVGNSGFSSYTFSGSGLIGSEDDPTIYLTRGEIYRFVIQSGPSHPFRIQSTPNGSAGTQYNDGLSGNDLTGGILTWDVQFDSPSKLYYQCVNHGSMGGVIHVLDKLPDGVISGSGQIASDISGSFTSISSSLAFNITGVDSRLNTLEGKTLLSSSAQISSDISGAFTSVSSSIAGDVVGLDGRLDTLEGKTLLSSSTQIASDISGAFTSTSSSIAGDITGLDSRLGNLEGKTLVSSSIQITLQDTTGNLSGSRIVGDVPSATSSSYAGNAELLDGQDSSVFATTGSNTFTGTQTFNNIQVNGTGSFNYIQSITGSAKIIGDAYIILNNNLPAEPFAGLKVLDTGSTDVTASLLWDGTNNHWIYENVSGSTYGAAGFMGGPRSSDINNILYPTQYKVLRSQGGDHLYDSNITDNDTNVSISIPLSVTGDITSSAKIKADTGFVGNLTGNADTSTTSSYVEYSNVGNKPTLVSSSIQINYSGLSGIPVGILSSSAQIASDISGAFNSTSSSLASDITGLDGRLDTLEGKTLLSSSAQIAVEISGAFTQTSASLALEVSQSDARLDILEGKTLVSSSSQISYSGLTGIPSGMVSSSIQVDHNSTTNYVSNQHIDHSSVSITAGDGLSGGGNITASRTLTLNTGSAHFTGGVKSKLNTDGVISGSSQVTYSGLTGIPVGIVSGSSQLNNSTLTGMTITGSFSGEGNNLNITGSARTFIGSQRGTITTDNDGSFDLNGGNNFTCTPTGTITLTFTNIASSTGQTGNILLINNSNYTVAAHTNTKVGSGVLTTLSATGTYWLSYYSNGTNVYISATGALS